VQQVKIHVTDGAIVQRSRIFGVTAGRLSDDPQNDLQLDSRQAATQQAAQQPILQPHKAVKVRIAHEMSPYL
jgi:hypothetical protein